MKVDINSAEMADIKGLLKNIESQSPKMLRMVINKGVTGGRTEAVSAIYEDLNLTKTRIRKDFTMKKMFVKDSSAWLKSKGKPIGLGEFSPTQKKDGVTVKIKRKGKRKLVKHAFMPSLRTGTAQVTGRQSRVFMRYYRYEDEGPYVGMRKGFSKRHYASLPSKYRYKDKIKLRTLTGPRIQDIYADPMRMKLVLIRTEKRMEKEADRLMDLVLSGKMVL